MGEGAPGHLRLNFLIGGGASGRSTAKCSTAKAWNSTKSSAVAQVGSNGAIVNCIARG
jgi:hypothetical protein